MEAVAAHLGNPKNTIKEAAITVFLNYSIVYLMKEDPEGRVQAMSALGQVAKESDAQCQARIKAAVNNLCYKSQDSKDLAKAMGLV